MVLELILLTLLGESIVIYGVSAWFRYTDLINELKGEHK